MQDSEAPVINHAAVPHGTAAHTRIADARKRAPPLEWAGQDGQRRGQKGYVWPFLPPASLATHGTKLKAGHPGRQSRKYVHGAQAESSQFLQLCRVYLQSMPSTLELLAQRCAGSVRAANQRLGLS